MKTWFITGCSTGFGRELAGALLEKGEQVVATARNPEQLKDLKEKYGNKVLTLKLDVTVEDDIKNSVKGTLEKFGQIDVLINNAGIGYFGGVEESEEEEVRKMFEINFWGLNHMTNAVLPHMRQRKTGTIVNISSVAGTKGMPGTGYYNATKFALEGISEALWQELEPLGIRVLIVEPSGFRTDWAGRSANEVKNPITDYDGTTTRERIEMLRDNSGKQAGDPKKAAKAIIADVEAGGPNHHLPLGNRSFEITIEKIEDLKQEYSKLESIARGADSPQ